MFYTLRLAEENAIKRADLRTLGIAHAFAEHADSTIKRVDIILKELAYTWINRQQSFIEEIDREKQAIADIAIQVAVHDKDGWLVFSSLGIPKERYNFADREHFQTHVGSNESQLFISKPVLGRISKKWSIQFTRPLIRNGKFDGVIVISVSPDLFSRFFQTLSLGNQQIAAMMHDGGAILARTPDWEDYVGKSPSETQVILPDTPLQGSVRRVSRFDGIERIVGYHRLPEYHLTLVAGISVDEILAPVATQRTTAIAIAFAVSLLILITAVLSQRSLLARERAEAEVRSINIELEQRVDQRTTELARTNAELEEAVSLNKEILNTSVIGVAVYRQDGQCIQVNPGFIKIMGEAEHQLLKQNLYAFPAWQESPMVDWADSALNAETHAPRQIQISTTSGNSKWIDCRLSRFFNRGEPHLLLMIQDITALKTHAEDLDRIANFDTLTGAANRRLLTDRLTQAIARTRRSGVPIAVCYLDLDGFKTINDQLGHAAGDKVLIEITRRLKLLLRAEDTVARLGGDEFVLILTELPKPEEICIVIDRMLKAVSAPMAIENTSVSVSASIGVTISPPDMPDSDSLLRHSDQAMYIAKTAGKNRYHLFTH